MRYYATSTKDRFSTSNWPPCGFYKNVSSRESVKLCFFVAFNIIISHIFSENFIEILEDIKTFPANISYFHLFSSTFWIFGHFLVTKKQLLTDDVSIFSQSYVDIRLFLLKIWRGERGQIDLESLPEKHPQKVQPY